MKIHDDVAVEIAARYLCGEIRSIVEATKEIAELLEERFGGGTDVPKK